MTNEYPYQYAATSPFPIIKLRFVLKKLIKEKGITIASLSRSTKVPLQTLHGWLQGNEPRNIRQVKKVADYFEVDINQLCFGLELQKTIIQDLQNVINAGIYEVVLRKII